MKKQMRNPSVPESLEGWWILHRMFAFDRRNWDALPEKRKRKYAQEATEYFERLHRGTSTDLSLAQIVGHKGDLMLTHYAETFDGLAEVQTHVDRLNLSDFLAPLGSYVSVLEIGLYDATGKIHAELEARGLTPQSKEWIEAFDAAIAQQAQSPHIAPRLWAKIPQRRYTCFYPMNKLRAPGANWYMLPFAERAKLMVEHGKVGRTYHGQVTQVISGSIGFDDYEWGVDLYADDPLVFKRLVYEMRFDEASAKYGDFGPFWPALQIPLTQLSNFLNETPT